MNDTDGKEPVAGVAGGPYEAPYGRREWEADYQYARKVRSGRHSPVGDGYRLGPSIRKAFEVVGVPEDEQL